MPLSPSMLAYEDVQGVLDQALDREIGISVDFPTPGAAIHFRQRCYKFRSLSHQIASHIDPTDPRHVASPYDTLIISQNRVHKNVIEVRKRESIKFNIKELKE